MLNCSLYTLCISGLKGSLYFHNYGFQPITEGESMEKYTSVDFNNLIFQSPCYQKKVCIYCDGGKIKRIAMDST